MLYDQDSVDVTQLIIGDNGLEMSQSEQLIDLTSSNKSAGKQLIDTRSNFEATVSKSFEQSEVLDLTEEDDDAMDDQKNRTDRQEATLSGRQPYRVVTKLLCL